MDEPLSNLDAKLRLEMRAEIRRIHTMLGCSTIYVTHDQEEALSLADRILVMIDGQTRQIGTPEDLYARPASADVAEFMGYRNLVDIAAPKPVDGGVAVTIGGARVHRHCRWRSRRAGDRSRSGPDDLRPTRGRADRGDGGDRRVPRPRLLCRRARPPTATDLYFRSDRRISRRRDGAPGRRARARAGLSAHERHAPVAAPPAARARAGRRDAAGAARRAVRAGAVHLSVPLRPGAVVHAEAGRLAGELQQVLLRSVPLRHDLADACRSPCRSRC